MLHPKVVQDLHSIRFRNVGFKRKPVLYPQAERQFNRFLINAIGHNVFVISTGLGLDVYYSSTQDYSQFIKKNLWLFKPANDVVAEKHFVATLHGPEVLDYFNTVVDSLITHPQLFLSCCKKFMQYYKDAGVKTRLLQLLYSTFEAHLQELISQERSPYTGRIKKMLNESEISEFKYFDEVDRLAYQSKNARNFN
ncbi:hypothetical protein [Leeuwenhoekiella palythoae]|uniref:hypothetical protein n=1 Tax=Leeuwenhoekiella palythoae TaxID=573501 RepID=UPI0035156526